MELAVLDLLLKNARVLTMDEARPRAHSVGILHGRIVGLDDEVADLSARQVIDCDGSTLTPGFVDAHQHMVLFGLSLRELDLAHCQTLDELYGEVATRAATLPSDGWVVGSGYDSARMGGHPQRAQLDRAANGRLVWLRHRSGHLGSVSSAVLERAGVLNASGENPSGGVIVRDDSGMPTGELQEQAQRLVTDLRNPRSGEDLVAAIARAAQVYVAEGLTHVTEAGIGGGWIGHSDIEANAYVEARDEGVLPLRVELMVAAESLHPVDSHQADPMSFGLDLGLRSGFGNDMLQLGPMKIFMDGSMTARTAALSELLCAHHDHSDQGYLADDPDELTRQIVSAHRAGWRVAAHAIGDQAIDVALDAFEKAHEFLPRNDMRHRIEHAALVRDDQLVRMTNLGIVPVHQGRFVHDIGEAVLEWIGTENASTLLRYKSFIDAGLCAPGSSDRPVVANASPLWGMQAMVQRTGKGGTLLSPDEAVTAEQALRAYTVEGAYASHAEHKRGRIAPGMYADLALLDDDPTSVRAEQIGSIEVLATYVDGSCVHGADRYMTTKTDVSA